MPDADIQNHVTPLIITFNEEANIKRTLDALYWASRIVIIDSGSTDATLEMISAHPNVQVFTRHFDNFANQCNAGLEKIQSAWCLSLDADHIVTDAFRAELEHLIAAAPPELAAVQSPFRYLIHGRPLQGSLLPPRHTLVRPNRGQFVNDGHGHHFVPAGPTWLMQQPLLHDDRKPLQRWLDAQQRYLRQEALKLQHTPQQQLSRADQIRLLHVVAPFAVLVLCLLWHRGILSGWRGWYYAFQRMYAEILLSLMLWEERSKTIIS